MLLYRITLVPMSEDLRKVDPGLLSPFYADDASFDGLVQRSAQLLKMLLERGTNQAYFTNPSNSIFILYSLDQEEAADR